MKKRDLRFENLTQVEVEIRYLLHKNLFTHGNWTVFQILTHLSDGLELCMYGGKPNFTFPGFLQETIGKLLFKKILWQKYMDSGLPNPVAPEPKREGDVSSAFERVLSNLEKFQRFSGNFTDHPVFGKLSKSEWETLQAYHFANHLSYISVI